MQTSSPTFSVEQVELIRRLRNSGVTCQQIVEAFQALERIDNELGTIYSVPVLLAGQSKRGGHSSSEVKSSVSAPQMNGSQSGSRHQATPGSSGDGRVSGDVTGSANLHGSYRNAAPIALFSNSSQFRGSPGPTSHASSQSAVTPTAGVLSTPGAKFSDTLREVAQAALTPTGKPSAGPGGQGSQLLPHETSTPDMTVMKSEKHINMGASGSAGNISGSMYSQEKVEMSDLTLDKCYAVLLNQNQETIKMLIQKFLMLVPDINLQRQALELGVGEVTMGQFMGGDWPSIESSARYKILEWFISRLRQTDWFLDDLTHLMKLQEYSDGLDVHFVPRRERFTFREKHLEVLEVFFKKGQYPTQEEKEHIANECNIAMAIDLDRELAEKEKMTHINVTNWFSNRRKEIKRIAKKGGIDTEKVILPSRVKAKVPSHLPTYDELAEEQMARQKFISGSLQSTFAWKAESEASQSQDSNFLNASTDYRTSPNTAAFSQDSNNLDPSMHFHQPTMDTDSAHSSASGVGIHFPPAHSGGTSFPQGPENSSASLLSQYTSFPQGSEANIVGASYPSRNGKKTVVKPDEQSDDSSHNPNASVNVKAEPPDDYNSGLV